MMDVTQLPARPSHVGCMAAGGDEQSIDPAAVHVHDLKALPPPVNLVR